MSSENNFIVALSQQCPTPLDVEGTLQRLAETTSKAADWGAQLLVLPEMSITGYNITPTEISNVAETHDGPIFEKRTCGVTWIAVFSQRVILCLRWWKCVAGKSVLQFAMTLNFQKPCGI